MNRMGQRTIRFDHEAYISSSACIAGKKEGEGPLASSFDEISTDDLMGTETWEKAESELLKKTIFKCIEKNRMNLENVDVLLAGDLNAQIISSGFAARDLGVPFLGMYGACSTMIESLLTGAVFVASGSFRNALSAASSHFCTAERQFRTPLELGTQRPPSAQWTATAAGACLIEGKRTEIEITSGTIGRVIDLKIKDANHMGAAMAPAVCDTLMGHLQDTGKTLKDYEKIVTGDLGKYGLDILKELVKKNKYSFSDEIFYDCGANLYSQEQDVHAGGSGCGCIAGVLAGHILKSMKDGKFAKILVLGSGAMMSVTSALQGESIPSISYAVSLERG
ncbi:MAG: stage V sporulation protein AD [Clostridia bacterium]|nr:stage V sporulation protein AD [Clostridia bacterium]